MNIDVPAPYYNRRDPDHVQVLCAAHAAEYIAEGWFPGWGKLGRCELPDPQFCAACRREAAGPSFAACKMKRG